MKKITLSLIKYSDFLGKLVTTICHGGYNHVSISLDEKVFYSFNYKGFAIEEANYKNQKTKVYENMRIQIYVPNKIFNILKNDIYQFINNKEQFSYTRAGLILCFLHIPHKFKNKYFCSQFVMELISNAGIVNPKRKASCYLPNHFVNNVEYLFPINKSIQYIS